MHHTSSSTAIIIATIANFFFIYLKNMEKQENNETIS